MSPRLFYLKKSPRLFYLRGGGVAIVCRNDRKMEPLPNLINDFECLWGKITSPNCMFYVATIYHPPDHTYNPDDLIEFLSDSCEQLLLTARNTKIIIACRRYKQIEYQSFIETTISFPNGQDTYQRR